MSEAHGLDVELSTNHLYVNGRRLEIEETTPDLLLRVMNLGRTAILSGIEEYYQTIKDRNPDAEVDKAPVFVTRLGTNSQKKRILTEAGQANGTSIHKHIEEINPKYHDLWHAINHSGFSAEVRSGFAGPNVGGIWLMLKNIDSDGAIKDYFKDEYPDDPIVCEVMPDTEEGIAPIRITDRNGVAYDYEVPSAAVIRLRPPRIDKSFEAADAFAGLIGLGLMACRIIDNDISEGILKAEFPTSYGPKQLYLPAQKLARKSTGRSQKRF